MGDQAVQNVCPGCGKELAPDGVVCIQCGFDKRQGRRLQTIKLVRRALCLPRISGARSFAVLLVCMAVTLLVVPMALKPTGLELPVWVEAEIIIAVWWAIWCVALTLFLYNGWLVTHDFQKPQFANPVRQAASARESGKDSYERGWWDGFFWGSLDFGGDDNPIVGCLALLALIILLPFIIVFLAQAAVLLAFVMYLLIRGMLAQVANSRLWCRNRLGRSLGFGVLYATLYTAPLAGLVWFVHRLHS
jgi:hypothetical protein